MRRALGPLLFGLIGAAILVALGVWQVQRLAWKEALLAELDARIAAEPAALPEAPEPGRDDYLPVAATGRIGARYIRVLVSRKRIGAGYRIVSPFETEAGRRMLLDRGFVPVEEPVPAPPAGPIAVTGNLHWPDETDAFTPEPDREGNIWFARDVGAMAAALETAPTLIVAREVPGQAGPLTPLPVGSAGIPNDHLQYALTWFSLAVIWLAMAGLWLRRRLTEGRKGEET